MPKPKPGQSESDWMSECISAKMEDGGAENHKQAVAICASMWRDRDKKEGCEDDEEKAMQAFLSKGFGFIVEEYYRLFDEGLVAL